MTRTLALLSLLLLTAPSPAPPPDATCTQRGLVTTATQDVCGLKQFEDGVQASFVDAGVGRFLFADAGIFHADTANIGAATIGVLDLTTLTCVTVKVGALYANFVDAGAVSSGLYTSNLGTGQVMFQSLVPPVAGGTPDFVWDTANARTPGSGQYLYEFRNHGTPITQISETGVIYAGSSVATGAGGAFYGPLWLAPYPGGNISISSRQHTDPGADLFIEGTRDPSDVTDRTAIGIALMENNTQTFAVTTSGAVFAGTQWANSAGYGAFNCSSAMGSGGLCLACQDPGTGCYVPIEGNITNGSHHGVLTAVNATWMDAGWLLDLKNPRGVLGQTSPGAASDSVFTVDFMGGFGQPARALQSSQFPPCPDPSAPVNESGHGSQESMLNWAVDTHHYYVCKPNNGGYVQMLDDQSISATNPITYSSGNIACTMAAAGQSGCVSTGDQHFTGIKRFDNLMVCSDSYADSTPYGASAFVLNSLDVDGYITTVSDGRGLTLAGRKGNQDPGTDVVVTGLHYRDAGSYFGVSAGAPVSSQFFSIASNGDVNFSAPLQSNGTSNNSLTDGVLTDNSALPGHVALQPSSGLGLVVRGRLADRFDAMNSDAGQPYDDGGTWVQTAADGGKSWAYAGLHGDVVVQPSGNRYGGWLFEVKNPPRGTGTVLAVDTLGGIVQQHGLVLTAFEQCPGTSITTSLGTFFYGAQTGTLLNDSSSNSWYVCKASGWTQIADTSSLSSGGFTDITTTTFKADAGYISALTVGALTGGAGGSNTQVQYNNNGSFGGMPNVTTDGTRLNITGETSHPSSPASNALHYDFRQGTSATSIPTTIDNFMKVPVPVGLLSQASWLGTASAWGMGCAKPQSSGSTNLIFDLMSSSALVSTGTASTVAWATTSLLTRNRWISYASSAATNSSAGLRYTSTSWLGSGAGTGGFVMSTRIAIHTSVSTQRFAVGMFNTTSALTATSDPNAATDDVYFGCNSTDSNLSICSNDNVGTATCTTLGASYPCHTADAVYDMQIFAPPNASSIGWAIQRLDSAANTSGSVSSDLPRNSVQLAYQNWINSAGTSSAVTLYFGGVCLADNLN